MNAQNNGEARDDEQVVFCLTSASRPHSKTATAYGVGSVLAGKYRLDSILGEGSVGTVWQATNLLLDSPVAIKLTHAELAGPEFRARLQLEARAAAGLGHPAIVRVFDVGETNLGDLFIVMELLQGASLAQMIAGGKLTAVRAVQIVLPIIDALAAMHARGIVHRDVKPDNLFISLEDRTVQPKILDFGIAKLSDSRGKVGDLNEKGMLIGSPEYMSPEQAMACDDIDFRTDIWSVCVALYEAMSGQTPFAMVSVEELFGAVAELEPASLAESGDCDELLWEIIRIGLAKDRYARHASMAELGRALASWLVSHGVADDACGTSLESRWFADDPVRSFPSSPDLLEAEIVKPDVLESERITSVESAPPSGVRAETRKVTYRRPGIRAIKALSVAAVVVTAFFAVTSNHDLSSLIASSKGATVTGARRAASVVSLALARQRSRGITGMRAP
ncbi:MAG TPA: serine/threonine-protein kinase [Polyangiaceae bacterium]|jgi:serine/threonine-protein kinase|nr:serine/threonine-protein kinase [Polyangiaceae bacterium]